MAERGIQFKTEKGPLEDIHLIDQYDHTLLRIEEVYSGGFRSTSTGKLKFHFIRHYVHDRTFRVRDFSETDTGFSMGKVLQVLEKRSLDLREAELAEERHAQAEKEREQRFKAFVSEFKGFSGNLQQWNSLIRFEVTLSEGEMREFLFKLKGTKFDGNVK